MFTKSVKEKKKELLYKSHSGGLRDRDFHRQLKTQPRKNCAAKKISVVLLLFFQSILYNVIKELLRAFSCIELRMRSAV